MSLKPLLVESQDKNATKYDDELTILASCLGDCFSGLEGVGRDGVFSPYSLLL